MNHQKFFFLTYNALFSSLVLNVKKFFNSILKLTEYSGNWKMLHYHAKKFFATHLVSSYFVDVETDAEHIGKEAVLRVYFTQNDVLNRRDNSEKLWKILITIQSLVILMRLLRVFMFNFFSQYSVFMCLKVINIASSVYYWLICVWNWT